MNPHLVDSLTTTNSVGKETNYFSMKKPREDKWVQNQKYPDVTQWYDIFMSSFTVTSIFNAI